MPKQKAKTTKTTKKTAPKATAPKKAESCEKPKQTSTARIPARW